MAGFHAFMEGKFGKFGTMPERVNGFGCDPDAAVSGTKSSVAMVDTSGGKGEVLLEVKSPYPDLPPDSLILQDHYAGNTSISGMKIVHWDYKGGNPPTGSWSSELQPHTYLPQSTGSRGFAVDAEDL